MPHAGYFAAFALALGLSGSLQAFDVVIDNDASAPDFDAPPYVETGDEWETSPTPGYNGGIYRFVIGNTPAATATWTSEIPADGLYNVSILFLRSTNRATSAPWTVHHQGGSTTVNVNMNGSLGMVEIPLGQFLFTAADGATIVLENSGSGNAYIADAVRIWDAAPVMNISHEPYYPGPSDSVTVTMNSVAPLTSVTVHYEASPSGTSGSVTAYDDGAHDDGGAGDGLWAATIPALPGEQLVSYYVETVNASDEAVNSDLYSYRTFSAQFRGVWADTWNISILNQSQVDTLLATARAANLNGVVVEVRKIGDAYYNSSIEPRATNISGGASFDPLGYLIQQAHDTSGGKKYIQVHAWFVMQRIWSGSTKPAGHVLVQHPEYRTYTSTGEYIAGSGIEYLDPGHPEAVNHNIAVILDCMQNYDIDGVNLDYIRYSEYPGEWGYNPVSIARFNAFYNKTGNPATNDPDWDAWRRECVTLQVKKLYVKMMQLKPQVVLTACTVNWGFAWDNFSSSSAYAGVFQDWKGWLEQGILDYNMLMNYSNDEQYPTRYKGWTDLSLSVDTIRGSYIGNGAYLQPTVNHTIEQMKYALDKGADGVVIYDWRSEVDGNTQGESRTDFYNSVGELFSNWLDAPVPAWKSNPTVGIFEGTVTDGGTPVDHAVVSIDGVSGSATHSDGSGWYGILELPPGTYTIRATAPGKADRTAIRSIAAGEIVTVDLDFADAAVQGWQLLD